MSPYYGLAVVLAEVRIRLAREAAQAQQQTKRTA